MSQAALSGPVSAGPSGGPLVGGVAVYGATASEVGWVLGVYGS